MLLPRLANASSPLPKVELLDSEDAGAHAVRIGKTIVVFAHEADDLKNLTLQAGEAENLVLLDAVPGGKYLVGSHVGDASEEGVLRLEELPAGEWKLVFRQP